MKEKPTQDQDQDQAALVQRAQSGDTAAFAELIRQAQPRVLVVTRAVLGDGHEAEDAAQEAFLRAWQKLGNLWVYDMAVDKLSHIMRFENLKPEGLTYSFDTEEFLITFDHGTKRPSKVMKWKPDEAHRPGHLFDMCRTRDGT